MLFSNLLKSTRSLDSFTGSTIGAKPPALTHTSSRSTVDIHYDDISPTDDDEGKARAPSMLLLPDSTAQDERDLEVDPIVKRLFWLSVYMQFIGCLDRGVIPGALQVFHSLYK